ncbi:hypothetical protein [Actinomyces johnsonii]|jgi:hypothetical protein|uniref:hypothetical protein n=1 Tax=Actinomyces johnsonii TaxID=544581 RepID=UPI0028D62DC7|nr:hypothetical protein [Actinomyces johnsonii]
MVHGLLPSAIPDCHGVPKPWQETLLSGADNVNPVELAVTVAVTGPAVAVAVTD